MGQEDELHNLQDLDLTREQMDANDMDPCLIQMKRSRTMMKLDCEKLLSSKGLPHLLKTGPKRARISKHKDEYQNLCHFLQFYQLWAHELYPKAKFRDFVIMCDRLGKGNGDLREYRMRMLSAELGMEPVGELSINNGLGPEDDIESTIVSESYVTRKESSSGTQNMLFVTSGTSDDERSVFTPEKTEEVELSALAKSTVPDQINGNQLLTGLHALEEETQQFEEEEDEDNLAILREIEEGI